MENENDSSDELEQLEEIQTQVKKEYVENLDKGMRQITSKTSNPTVLKQAYAIFQELENKFNEDYKMCIDPGIHEWMDGYLSRKRFWSLDICFDGDPKDWGGFSELYKQSNEAANFSKADNLLRFKEYLKGEAKREVAHLLEDPENVDEIMKILEIKYGQKEIIYEAFCRSILEFELDNTDNNLSWFAIECKNMAYAFRNDEKYANDPYIYREVLQKIPKSLREAWSEEVAKDANKHENFDELSSWLDDYVWNSTDRRRILYGEKICPLCNSIHPVYFCDIFKKMKLEERQKWVEDNNYCAGCLKTNEHKVENCPKAKVCREKYCEEKHSYLLHEPDKEWDWWWNFASWMDAFGWK